MMPRHRTLNALAMAAAAALWLAATPADAQRAVPRGGGSDSSSQGGGGGGSSSSGGGDSGRRAPSGGGRVSSGGGSTAQSGGRSEPRDTGSSRTAQGSRPASPRARGDRPGIGQAVPRDGVPPPRDRDTVRVYGYPWGYGGIGFYGGYYGSYYDPWWWNDPWWYGPGYPTYPRYYPQYDDGAIRLQVTPREAAVYVDGYYAGIVDDFDGFFQRLHIDSGGHRLEFRLDGYETLSVDLHVQPDRTITYHGELQPIR